MHTNVRFDTLNLTLERRENKKNCQLHTNVEASFVRIMWTIYNWWGSKVKVWNYSSNKINIYIHFVSQSQTKWNRKGLVSSWWESDFSMTTWMITTIKKWQRQKLLTSDYLHTFNFDQCRWLLMRIQLVALDLNTKFTRKIRMRKIKDFAAQRNF